MVTINQKILSYFKNTKKQENILSNSLKSQTNTTFLKKQETFWYLQLKVLTKTLIKKRLHLGQHKSFLNPNLEAYIHGIKNNFCIINLKITVRQLQNVLKLIYHLGTQEGSSFMIVGTQEGLQKPIEIISNKFNFNYINTDSRISGLLTNTKSLKRAALLDYTVDRKFKKFENFVQPDILIVLNPQNHHDIINEANIKNIPVIGLVDTHCTLTGIDYPVVMNNESIDGLYFVLQLILLAFSHGRELKDQKKIIEKYIKK